MSSFRSVHNSFEESKEVPCVRKKKSCFSNNLRSLFSSSDNKDVTCRFRYNKIYVRCECFRLGETGLKMMLEKSVSRKFSENESFREGFEGQKREFQEINKVKMAFVYETIKATCGFS